MLYGFINLPWWGYLMVLLGLTHITIVSVTIYLHRHQAHHALDLHPGLSHFFRFWLWLTTGICTKEWVAIHRKHHAKVETVDDPHSPVIKGINKVLWEGLELYRAEAANQATLDDYGHATPADWLERKLYSKYTSLGISCLLIIDFALFGLIGISIWAIQMAWIPFFAAGVINGAGHWYGYRNFESADASTNIIPVAVFIGGEELHNNHHAFASSAKFSNKPWEFDLGWQYIRLLSAAGLAKVKKLAPTPILNSDNPLIDHDTVSAVISNRWHVMSDYAQKVIGGVYQEEMRKANATSKILLRRGKKLLSRADSLLDSSAREHLEHILAESETLNEVYEFKQRLQNIWQEKSATHESLVLHLQEWCRQAEETGIKVLEEFSRNIRAYTLQPQPAYG
jgi:stearoyl-CoA desaturase (delta-9 desaturase)